jgi:hypothetical protein
MLDWLCVTGAYLPPSTTHITRGLANITDQYPVAAAHLLGYVAAYLDTALSFDRTTPTPNEPIVDQDLDAKYGRNRKTGRAVGGQSTFVKHNLVSWTTQGTHISAQVLLPRRDRRFVWRHDHAHEDPEISRYILACTDVREDNRAFIRYARDIGMAMAARSLVQHSHSGRSLQQEGIINITPVVSADNRADCFTKLQRKDPFRASIHRLGLQSVADGRAARKHLAAAKRG